MHCLHRQGRELAAYRQQQMGCQMFSGSCVTPWNPHDKSKNITKQSQSWSWQSLHNGDDFYHDMALVFTISYHPSALWVAPDCGRNLFCCLPLLCSGEDCTCVNYFQGYTYCHETVLDHTSAIQDSFCFCVVYLVDFQPSFSNKNVKHWFEDILGDDTVGSWAVLR